MDISEKKIIVSTVLRDLEVILHRAIDDKIETNLDPYQMLFVSTKVLYERKQKEKSAPDKVGNVLAFPKKS